jgi:hypothetical protein
MYDYAGQGETSSCIIRRSVTTHKDLPIRNLSYSVLLRNLARRVSVKMTITEAITVKSPVITLVIFVSEQSIYSILC